MRLLILIVIPFFLKAQKSERYYQQLFVDQNGGSMEVIMSDGSRCDIITQTHAIEVDFAQKWAEAIGQSLNYARQTKKKAGIVLIINKDRDQRKIARLVNTIQHYKLPISVFLVEIISADS